MSKDQIDDMDRSLRYRVRTRESLLQEIAIGDVPQEGKTVDESTLLAAALKKMDQEGWKLVAATGEALLFRVSQH